MLQARPSLCLLSLSQLSSPQEHSHDEAFMTRFRDEIEIMADMHHPNVVMFLGASIDHANMCLVLEYCDYGDLISLLESREREINVGHFF